ncbi:MAG: hypothetical protein AB1585_08625 [Thermodesulfobacteriota bacterium]
MADPKCETCAMRAKYDRNPKSFLGRFWRWHIRWCPGWKAYMGSLPEERRREVREKYNLPNPSGK